MVMVTFSVPNLLFHIHVPHGVIHMKYSLCTGWWGEKTGLLTRFKIIERKNNL